MICIMCMVFFICKTSANIDLCTQKIYSWPGYQMYCIEIRVKCELTKNYIFIISEKNKFNASYFGYDKMNAE